ncbi:hypothetical protein [Acinetobacter sp. YH12142]|uniref:hypothetical protein n=1 Tax=Acinetobacter sp. YH12142 TaxID=2601126 RepID=UPI00211DAF76|nr:hypothetical protein [Acinetobacter sp. YH12142]
MLRTLTQQRTTSKLQLALGCAIALSASANWAASPQEIKKIAESQKTQLFRDLENLGQY